MISAPTPRQQPIVPSSLSKSAPQPEQSTSTRGARPNQAHQASAATFDPTTRRGPVAVSSGGCLLSGLVSVSADPQVAAANPTSFSRQVRSNFSTWDKNSDGYLSRPELDQLLQDPSITGDQAAAVSALRSRLDHLEEGSNDEVGDENDGVTLRDIAAHERAVSRGDLQARYVEGGFQVGQRNIRTTSRDLFPQGRANPNAITQGRIGDCYFLAAVGGVLARDPDAVNRMINDNRDGTFTVTFPGQDPITVDAPTDGEIARFGTAGANGIWLSVLEKAYGENRNDRAWLGETDVAQDAADGGAMLSEGISIMTGASTNMDILSLTGLDTTRNRLTAAMREGRAVTAGTRGQLPGEDARVQGVPRGHAYAVTNYDPATDQITLRNPWGSGEITDASGNPRDGVNDGVFTMSLEEFQSIFSMIGYEE